MSIRSLLSGVSGLRNFQFQLDVVGNNIANSQTPGFKSQRVTFQDLLTQTIRGATAPAADGSVGGTNPQEVGLGTSVGAIDTDFTQGNILNTGRLTDLAIQGEGFYKLSDGTNTFYSRAGAFDIDSAGNLVSTTTGYIVQGFNATTGVLSSTVENIQLPVGVVLPAQETTTVSLVGNLDSSDSQSGSILETESLLARELTASNNDIDGLYASGSLGGRIAGMQSGTSSVTFNDGTGATTYTYTTGTPAADQFNSIADLASEINVDYAGVTVTVDASGQIDVTDGGGGSTITMSSNNSSLNTALSTLNGVLGGGGNAQSDEFSHTAISTDLLTNMLNSTGTHLGVAVGNTLSFNADIGGLAVSPTPTLAVAIGTTLDDFADAITTNLKITNTADNVEVTSSGSIRITGDGGTDFAISNVDITSNIGGEFDNVFDSTSGNYTTLQSAGDNYTTSFVAFDTDGAQHTVTMRFNIRDAVGGNARWFWTVDSVETSSGTTETITSPARSFGDPHGTILFDGDGSLESPTGTSIVINTTGIGDDINLSVDFGTIDAFDGLVSFENTSSGRFADITGFASGELQTITVNTEGIVTGNFTNGQNQTLAQVVLSLFDNASGLSKQGQNLFSATINSGVGSDGAPNVGGRGSLIPSALEGSNVDLAQEFINLITAQRGFQTNARVITTADTILGELVRIVR